MKEDLLDDIIKESGPYQPPDRIQLRSEMASGRTEGSPEEQDDLIKPNE